jgi:hypothetical protein
VTLVRNSSSNTTVDRIIRYCQRYFNSLPDQSPLRVLLIVGLR